jgi:hypothetical protein
MRAKIYLLVLFCHVMINRALHAQIITTTGIEINHPSMAGNTDYTGIYREDTQVDRTVLKIRMGDEVTSDFHIGYTAWQTGLWNSTFSLDGYGNGYFQGSIGIGITNPQAKFVLRQTTASQGLIVGNCDASGNQSHLGFTTADQPKIGLASESYLNYYNDGKWNINSGNTNGTTLPIAFSTNDVSRLFIKADGNVGIGTTNPNQKLTVNGTIYGKEVKVDLNVPGPDYVFEENYDLPSLTETEAYIKAHKHLPEVPSAKEMEANGINLSEMNMLLLRKIEELTLHLIEQKKLVEKFQASQISADASAKKVEELTLHVIEQDREMKLLKKELEDLKKIR